MPTSNRLSSSKYRFMHTPVCRLTDDRLYSSCYGAAYSLIIEGGSSRAITALTQDIWFCADGFLFGGVEGHTYRFAPEQSTNYRHKLTRESPYHSQEMTLLRGNQTVAYYAMRVFTALRALILEEPSFFNTPVNSKRLCERVQEYSRRNPDREYHLTTTSAALARHLMAHQELYRRLLGVRVYRHHKFYTVMVTLEGEISYHGPFSEYVRKHDIFDRAIPVLHIERKKVYHTYKEAGLDLQINPDFIRLQLLGDVPYVQVQGVRYTFRLAGPADNS